MDPFPTESLLPSDTANLFGIDMSVDRKSHLGVARMRLVDGQVEVTAQPRSDFQPLVESNLKSFTFNLKHFILGEVGLTFL